MRWKTRGTRFKMLQQSTIQSQMDTILLIKDLLDKEPTHAQNIENLAMARRANHQSRIIFTKSFRWFVNYPHYTCVECYAKVHHTPVSKVQQAVNERRFPLWTHDNTGGLCVCEVCGETKPIIA